MKEKIIQGGIVNGVKMLVCPTWEEDFQTEIHKTGGCLRISMNYSAADVSYSISRQLLLSNHDLQ